MTMPCVALFENGRTFGYVRNREYRRARSLVHDKVGPAPHCDVNPRSNSGPRKRSDNLIVAE